LLSKKLKIKTYRNIILPVVLYGCETWSHTLKEKLRLSGLEKNVLKKIFGPKKDKLTGEWGTLQYEEPNGLYSSPNTIQMIKLRRMRWEGHVACMGESRGAQRVLVGKQEGKRQLGRPRYRWEDNIQMDLHEVGWGGMDWSHLA
jgi:hypothetical protein